jgi:predicted O-methyltransferase YrrM
MLMQDQRAKIKSELMTPHIRDYIDRHARCPHPYLEVIREDCLNHKWHFMLTTRDQVAFLHTQALMIQAKKIIEIGSYYGHSTLALAAALPEDGKLFAIEHNPKFARAAQDHLRAAGVMGRVEFVVSEALPALRQLRTTQSPESIDLIFIDADKRHARDYWELSLGLVRSRGLIVVDNALARGEVVEDLESTAEHVNAVRAFNEQVLHDERVHSLIVSIADGMLLAVKK